MKIAYIVLAHTDPRHIARLCKKVTENTENHAFLHIDLKTDIAPFLKECSSVKNLHFVKKRSEIHWGGFNSVTATVEAFKEATEFDEFDYYQILQGLDYPIKSNREIERFFVDNKEKEFIRAINDSNAERLIDKFRYVLNWSYDKTGFFSQLRKYYNISQLKIFKKLLPRKKLYLTVDGNRYDIFRGWAHFALSHGAVEYCIAFYNNHPEVNEYFKKVYSSDESYFHTVIFNSPFRDKVIDGEPVKEKNRSYTAYLNLTYFEYPDEGVVLFKAKEDYEKLNNTGFLFFRKASSESRELLDYIDSQH